MYCPGCLQQHAMSSQHIFYVAPLHFRLSIPIHFLDHSTTISMSSSHIFYGRAVAVAVAVKVAVAVEVAAVP
eukprot:6185783-Karenia_brevis.AAC.1